MNEKTMKTIAAFFDAAFIEYPFLQGSETITRKQVQEICNKYDIKWPMAFANPQNTVSRGVYKMPSVNLSVVPKAPAETEEEMSNRLKERYSAMKLCVKAAGEGKSRSVIISGPAGVGKSYGVHEVLDAMAEANSNLSFNFVSGYTRPLGLYKLLYENRLPGQVLVLDDIDSCFGDEIAMNILKKACDMSKSRRLSWLSKVILEDEDGNDIPKTFDYEGTIIFITNLDFDAQVTSNSKLAPHFQALISRSLYVDLSIKTPREYIVRIKQVVRENGMLESEGFSNTEQETILDYIDRNSNKLRELSLRMVSKLATIYRIDPANWEKLASVSCLKAYS